MQAYINKKNGPYVQIEKKCKINLEKMSCLCHHKHNFQPVSGRKALDPDNHKEEENHPPPKSFQKHHLLQQ